jgi:hypothetical protein
MPIPSYKQVHIKGSDQNNITKQLSIHKYGNIPYVFIITHLENQIEAIENIETYLKDYEVPLWPYPIYVISSLTEYSGSLDIFDDIKSCPQFYNQKVKTPNVKEQDILHKLTLKQKNISNLKSYEYKPALDNYATGHKTIYRLSSEGLYLENLLFKLRDLND